MMFNIENVTVKFLYLGMDSQSMKILRFHILTVTSHKWVQVFKKCIKHKIIIKYCDTSNKKSARLDYSGACNDQMKDTSQKRLPFSYLGLLYLKYQNMNNICPARSTHLFFGDSEITFLR